ncbi:MAG: Uma2 family endonuclease [Salinibacter sp.]|uniref:Uma2 family endonuclease n=1 Tax=Salinibacter sp. TaxID=2065818 RepID=UPI002FC3B9FA
MATATAPPTPPTQRRFTVDEYERMAEAGVLPEDENVELLDGRIYRMSPIGSRRAACIRRLNQFFQVRLQSQALVSVQHPVRLDEASEPEPDLTLLAPQKDDYSTHHPGPDDVFLLVEVADTSLDFDRETKGPLYARAGISEYWVIALDDEQVHVFRDPERKQFETHKTYGLADEIAVATLSTLDPVPVKQILGA